MTIQRWLVWGVCVLLLAACGSGNNSALLTATPRAFDTAAPTRVLAAPTQTPGGPTITPSPTLPPTVTPTDTPPPPPPSATPTATPTPGPFEHVIKSGDTCLGIAYQYGHVHPDVKRAIELLNGIADCAILPGPGTTILVPRPTATPTEIGADLTQTAIATSAPPNLALAATPSFAVKPYIVQAGDTLSSIAIIHDSSLRQICELNPLPGGIDCRACTWESPNCCCTRPVVLSEGQQINVPAPTPTPTFTPTFTGSETPTPTPTHRAPQPISPANGVQISGPVRLSWLSVGLLQADETYLVTVRDETTGAAYAGSTRQLSLDLPVAYLPQDGQQHVFVWQVSVVRLGQDGLYYPVGALVPEQRFTWLGWQ
ncbi:MAG: LysM peptidoglycan-binding domain-containing protein [Aggregatilineaceae bacterium]